MREWEAGANQGAGGLHDPGHAEPASIAIRAAAQRRGVELIGDPVAHSPCGEDPVDESGDRDGILGEAVEVVRRAVERVSHKHDAVQHVPSSPTRQIGRQLLTEDPRVGHPVVNDGTERFLGSAVDCRDVVCGCLLFPPDLREAAHMGLEDTGGGCGGLHGDGQQLCRVGRVLPARLAARLRRHRFFRRASRRHRRAAGMGSGRLRRPAASSTFAQ